MTNDAWSLVNAQESGVGYPVLLMDKYSKGYLYVWTMPDNFRNLYALPVEATTAIKDVVMKDFFVRVDGPAQVALFAYDNGAFVLESYLGQPVTERVVVNGTFTKLRNLETGEVTASYVPEPPKFPMRRRLRTKDEPKSYFKVPVLPHSYAAYTAEP